MERTIARALDGLMVLLGLTLLAMVGLSVWNVVARYIFNSALLWADEIAIFAMIIVTWLGAIVAAWRGAEISMGIVVAALPRGLQRPIQIGQQVVTAVMCGWAGWLSWDYVARVFRFGMRSDAAHVPIWAVHGTITLSLICMTLIAIWRAVSLFHVKRATGSAALKIEEKAS